MRLNLRLSLAQGRRIQPLFMRFCSTAVVLMILCAVSAWAQSQAKPAGGSAPDQAAKPAEPQGHTTLIGCLSGPDVNGKFTLHSMSHRTGVEVFGAEDLKNASGGKVQLTGLWKPPDDPGGTNGVKKERKFQASTVEVLSEKCESPSEKTPVSKQKQAKEPQKQKNSTNPPTTEDSSH